MRARRALRPARAVSARRSIGISWRTSISPSRSCCPAVSMPAMSRRRCAAPARPASMSPPGSRMHPARRMPTRSAPSSRPPARPPHCRPPSRRARRPPRWAAGDWCVDSVKTEQRMTVQQPNSFRTGPDERGHFGIYGGRFVAETLMPLILELEKAYAAAKADPAFKAEMDGYLTHYVGRPSPLYFAERLTEHCGGAKIYFKRDELNHTGAHKVNNVLGQIMVARRMGKRRIIAETGAGMHGVAAATLCARFGLDCIVYMGSVDVERQRANVFRMTMLGAKVVPVESGSKTLKDAMNEALRDWVTNVESTFYCIGTIAGPHPYPMMVRDFQPLIGRETRGQLQGAEGRRAG